MNQSLMHADVILRDRARERERHVEEGRVLRALDAAPSGRGRGLQVSSPGTAPESSGIRARIGQLWRGLWLPPQPEAQRPLCPDPSL